MPFQNHFKSRSLVRHLFTSTYNHLSCHAMCWQAFEGTVTYNIRMPSVGNYKVDICQDPEYVATPPSLVTTYIIQVSGNLSLSVT